jgi:hypothetical protein
VVYWAEPDLAAGIDPDGRPVVVMATYQVPAENEPAFLHAMARVRDSRLRTGAVRWGLYRDGEDANSFVELFVVPSWEEHLRQHHERQTGTDRDYAQRASELSAHRAQVSHLISVEVPRADVR